MAKQRKAPVPKPSSRARNGTKIRRKRESLGDQLLREADEQHDDFAAGFRQFLNELGIKGKPIGAKKLRELLLQDGIDPGKNEFSRGIIAAREE